MTSEQFVKAPYGNPNRPDKGSGYAWQCRLCGEFAGTVHLPVCDHDWPCRCPMTRDQSLEEFAESHNCNV